MIRDTFFYVQVRFDLCVFPILVQCSESYDPTMLVECAKITSIRLDLNIAHVPQREN